MKKIGVIGLDTSHVIAFTELINDPGHVHHVPGAKVTVAWPGGSPDFALSRDRVEGYTATLRDQHGVHIVDNPEAVAEACDVLFIESVDGRVHLEQFQRTVSYERPTFIDKPFTVALEDAREIARLAKESGIPLMSCSSLRYADALQEALAGGRDDILGCDVSGPMALQETQPGLFWYGCHSVEMMIAAMGSGCREVRCVQTKGHDVLTAVWEDGRIASMHGVRDGHGNFGISLHRKDRFEVIDTAAGRPCYAGLVAVILGNLLDGRSPIPMEEMIEVVAIMEAGNSSRQQGGVAVAVKC